ncbi:nuclear GTPase SLIP-GC isoform X3 [Crotalus tigris]|uniref:nuclear GTPase SLIP-GC isoform X3 n=1 Tax=Crotalus tigris TaxID=88082 RepID=UPI00192FB323|nr:nuclear GTPase SLIP-GC isoform X3 [Crotalus tigris]
MRRGRRAQAQRTARLSLSLSLRRIGGASALARKETEGAARERQAASRGAPTPLPPRSTGLPGRGQSGKKGESPEMALPCLLSGEGSQLSHLRSIGPWAPTPGSSEIVHFDKAVTLFGRNQQVVDYCLNSPAATPTDLKYISRIHARIIRTDGAYILVDSSLTGVYVNDIRIEGRVILREGDTVTFGHPAGKNLLLGSHTRQPNSPFYFLFEHCNCCPDQMQSVYGERRNFSQLLKRPDMVSAGVSHPGNPNLAFVHHIPRPQMALPGVLPGQAPLLNSVTQRDHHTALAPPPTPVLSASSPMTAPLSTSSQDSTLGGPETSDQTGFPSSSALPLSSPCGPASQVRRSASPDYTLPKDNSFAAPEFSPLQENSESSESVSLSSSSCSESAVEYDTPNAQQLFQHKDARSDPERACVPLLFPGPTCSEVSVAADHDGSPKPVEASGPWEETFTPVFPTETGGASGCASSVFSPESPAPSETVQDEELAEMNLCPSMEETASASWASEPDNPVKEMEGVELAGSRARAASGSIDGCNENLVEKHLLKASFSEEEAVENRAISLSAEIQASSGLGHVQQHNSARRTAEICFSSGEEPMDDSSTKILSQERLDSERRNVLLPSRNSLCGTQSGDMDYTINSLQRVTASEDVEMEPPTDAGLEGVDGHLHGREHEPEIPGDAGGSCSKASVVDICAEMGLWSDGVKPGEMEVAVTESFKDVNPAQRPSANGPDSKARVVKEMLLQKLSETLVLDEQFSGRFFKEEKKSWSEASEKIDRHLHSEDLPETCEEGRVLGTVLSQACPVLRENTALAEASGTSVSKPPGNLGELVFDQCPFQSSKIPFEHQVEGSSTTEEKLEHENQKGAEPSNNSNNITAGSRLQEDIEKLSESNDSSLGIVDVSMVGLSGVEWPSFESGSDRRCQADSKDLPGEEETGVKTRITGTAAATNKDVANQDREAEDGPDKELRCLVEQEKVQHPGADASLTRSPNADPAECCSLGLVGGKGDSSREGEGLEEGRISHLGDYSPGGTQLSSLKSQHEAGERSGSDCNHFVTSQDVTEDEQSTSLNEEDPVKTNLGEEEEEEEARASPVANIPLAVTKRDFDQSPMQVGLLNELCSTFSCVINQQQCLTDVDPQELKSDIVEPENLGNYLEVKSQGADVREKLLFLEDPLIQHGASEEPEAPVEQISLPVPEEHTQGVLVPEESGGFGQIAENSRCSKARSGTVLPLPSIGLLQPGTVAVNLPGEPRDDSAQAPQLPEEKEEEQDELHLHISASEAEKEEKGQFSPFKTYDLPRRRDSSLLDPVEQIVNALGSSGALREPIEESTVQRPGDLAIQEASAGPLKGTEMLKMNLEGQTCSHQDQGPPVRAASPTARTEPGDPSSLSAKSRRRTSEAPEDPGGDEMELDPVSWAGQPAESPSDSAKEDTRIVKILSKDHGFIENTSQGLLQDSWPVAGRLPGQPDGATMASPPGEAVKELPGSEMSSSSCSGEDEYAQDAGRMHQDIDRLPCQESVCQLGNGPDPSAGYSGGLGCLEPCRALLQEEEELNSSSPRKRHQNEELDLEGDACHQKKLCRQHFVSVPGSASDPASFPVVLPPPPPDLKRSDEQFGKMIVKFLDQCRNQIPLRSDPTQRNGDAIAQIVRSYFKSNIGSNEPATENGKAEELKALSSETAAVKDIGCQPEGGGGDPGESLGCNGPSSPDGEKEDAQIPEDAHVSPGVRSAGSGSSTKEEGKGSAGTVQEAYYFQEEPFPLEAGSALEDSSSSSPAEAPNAESTEVPFEEGDAFSSPDIPPSSQSHESSPSPYWSRSDKLLGGPSESSGTLSELEWYSPSDAGGYDEDSDMAVSDDSQALPGDIRPESVRPLSPSEQEAPGQWLQGGEPDGGDRPDGSACREDSGKALEGDRSGMLTEGGVFPHQGSPRGSPGPDKMESTPVTSEPFTQSPWESSSKTVLQSGVGHCDLPLKTELTDEESDGQDYRRDESPSPSGRTPVASAQGGEGPTPAEGSAWLLVKEEPVQEDAPLPCKGDESSLPALCPTQAGDSAGTAVYTGSPLEKEGCRPECGAQQAASYQTSQEAPWIPVTSGGFPAKDDVYVDQGPCRALPLQRDGSRLAQSPLADMELRSQAFEEEKNQLCPHLSYPTSHVPKTSADEQPEGSSHPADFGGREPQFPYKSEEAGLAEPSDAECLRVAAAVSCPAPPAFRERAPLFRDPPAWRGSQSSCLRERAESRSPTEWASSEQDVAFQLQECQSVLAEIFQALSSVEGVDNTHVEKWRDQIAVLQKATKMPQTHIAVVGNTGAGKSCLLNALLDEEAMLPTSAMRACTAVVVEISRAAEGSPYEADVEFLSWEEWNKELEALLEDMKDKAGILKKRCPDRKTEAGAAYSRVKAVYGRVDELEKLEDRQGVTQHLGTVKRICAETAADFHMKIEKFIDSRTDNLREMKGGEFWPIVKCVRIRVAKAEVLRTGAVLVDLPGIRDSNAARDTVAREYLKDCNAVWVTASITRAVDDKTARELLSANFRRQLFMDGLYGSLAFICTKTDSFSITDIVRDLSLQDKICPLEEGLQELEKQKTQAEIEKKHLYTQLQQQEPARKGSAAADSVWLQRHDILEKEFQICSLQREKDAKLRAISLICVQARNEFSKQRILMDFSAGLQEVSRRAEGEDDGEEEVEEGDSTGGQPGKLEVFTVSSTEYLKLGGKLLCNGQPQVFHDVKDTEIPALKKFAMDTALKHSMVATEKVIRDVARVLSQMVNYLNSQRTEADAHQAQVQETLQQALQDLPALLHGVLGASSQDLRQAFEALILGSLQNGAERAKQHSEAIVRGWGSPVCGYPHVTYRAICNHRGVYTSPKYQSVDFNRELSGPILQVISVAWNEVFNSRLVSSIEGFTRALLAQLKSFFKGLKKKLLWHGPVSEALHAICAQQMEATQARLLNFTLDQMSSVTRKQRTISRLLIPTIQAGMEPAYAACSRLSGPGYFRRMKEEMETFIHRQKDALFDSAVEKLWQQLELLQLSIRCSLKTVAQELATSIRMQFEPLLRPVQKNKEILPELQHLCAKVDKICQRSGVDYMLPVALQPEEQPPGTEAKLLGNRDHVSLPATSMDVRVGALSLPRLSDIEVSEDHITLTLAGDPTKAALPLRSVSRWECCLPLGCLILHVSAKAAREICFQCRIPMPSPGLGSQEALVIREASQGERQLPKLRHCLAARLSDASRVQELSPEQGWEELVSLGVFYPGQQRPESAESGEPRVASTPEPMVLDAAAGQPLQPPVLPWHPHGRKRAWEGVLLQLEKKTRLHSVGPAGYPGLQCSQRAETEPTSHSAALLGSCSPEGAFLPDGSPCPVVKDLEGEPLAVTHSAGLLWVGVNKGTHGKPPSLTVKEEEAHLPAKKTCFEL